MRTLKANGVDINVNTKVLEVTDHDVKVQRKDGTEEWLRGFDYIIFGLGARNYDPLSEELKAFVPEVHVIGDAVKAARAATPCGRASRSRITCNPAQPLRGGKRPGGHHQGGEKAWMPQ